MILRFCAAGAALRRAERFPRNLTHFFNYRGLRIFADTPHCTEFENSNARGMPNIFHSAPWYKLCCTPQRLPVTERGHFAVSRLIQKAFCGHGAI